MSPNSNYLTTAGSRILSLLQTAKLKSLTDVNGSSPLIPTGYRAGRESALGRTPTWEGKVIFQSSFQLLVQSQDFQNDYLFKLLGILICAASSGICSTHLLKPNYKENGGRMLETFHLRNNSRWGTGVKNCNYIVCEEWKEKRKISENSSYSTGEPLVLTAAPLKNLATIISIVQVGKHKTLKSRALFKAKLH